MKDDLIKAAEHMSDKGYEESTHEKQAEFAKKRNYPIPEEGGFIDVAGMTLEEVRRMNRE